MRLRSLKFAVEFSLCRISKPYGCVSEIHKNDWLKKSVHPNNNKGTFSHSSHPSKLRGKCLHLEEFVELTAFGGTEQQQFPPKKSYISWSTKSPLLPKNNLLFGGPMQDSEQRKNSLSTHESCNIFMKISVNNHSLWLGRTRWEERLHLYPHTEAAACVMSWAPSFRLSSCTVPHRDWRTSGLSRTFSPWSQGWRLTLLCFGYFCGKGKHCRPHR